MYIYIYIYRYIYRERCAVLAGRMVGVRMVGGRMVGGRMVGGRMVGGRMVGGRMVRLILWEHLHFATCYFLFDLTMKRFQFCCY